LIVVIVNFDFFEVALDLSPARARLNLDRRVGRNRNLHVALAVINLDIPRLVQPDLDRPVFIFQSQIPRQTSSATSLDRVVRRIGPDSESARRSPESRSSLPSRRVNSISVRDERKLTVLLTRTSRTLS